MPPPRMLTDAQKENKRRVDALLTLLAASGGKRVRVFLGDPETGRDWGEENDVGGHIGRSTGRQPVLLMIPTSRSHGGTAILSGNVLRVLVDGKEAYRHPKYQEPVYEVRHGNVPGLPFEVWRDGRNEANFSTALKRQRWLDFMRGLRATK